MNIKKGGTIDFGFRLFRRYIDDEIGLNAAALSYYMVFSFFPVIIVLSMVLGFADVDIDAVTSALAKFMPKDVIDIVDMYLSYVSENRNGNILAVSAVFMVYLPVRAVNYIMVGVDKAYGSVKKRKLWKKITLTVVFSLVLIFNIFTSFVLLSVGRGLLSLVSHLNIIIPVEFIDVWVYLRFLIMAAIASVSITALYVLAPARKVGFVNAVPGAVAAVSLWVIVSAAFSFYVENMGKYSILFGSVGAVIVLLLWLYITATILLLGAEINAVLEEMNTEKP